MSSVINNAIRFAQAGVLAITLPISVIHFYLLATTSVIHVNLRWLLLFQCIIVTLIATSSMPELIARFWDPNWRISFAEAIKIFGFTARSIVGDFMIFERVLATFYVSKYEQFKRPHFGACAILMTFVLSILMTYENQTKVKGVYVPQIAFFMSYILTIWSLISVVALMMLLYYNQRTYNRKIGLYHSHSLTERYQLSENIRTSRQLIPVIFLHFLSNLFGATGAIVLYHFGRNFENWLPVYGNSLLLSIFSYNFVIQIAVIRCHPILHKRARQMCARLRKAISSPIAVFSNSKSRHTGSVASDPELPLSINGTHLINSPQQESDAHFGMLIKLWK